MNTTTAEYFGQDPKIVKALKVAGNVAVTKAPVLVVGEAGVGKKTLAKFIHENSTRAGKTIISVDCSADSLQVENEILGYRDAEGRFVKGAFENANGGSVVLVNIDGLQDDFQKKLHKIIGELEDYDIDLRLIATTTKNLSKLVGAGRFYRGLYTALSSNSISLSPLRERVGDLEMIAKNIVNELTGDRDVTVETAAMQKIIGHYWTHNVKELHAVLESTVANFEGNEITEELLEIGEKKAVNIISDDDSEGIRLMSLKEAERLLIKKALVHTSENRTQAAKILGVSIRTLRNKINEYRNEGNSYFVNLR